MDPADPDSSVVLAWKRERRAAIRRLHPDRGGSASELMRALAEVDAKYGLVARGTSTPNAESEVVVTHTRTYLLRLGFRRLQLLIATARAHIPRNLPGSRRSTHI